MAVGSASGDYGLQLGAACSGRRRARACSSRSSGRRLERRLGLTTLEKAVAWAQSKSMWPDTFGLACCAMEMMSIVSSRYDIARFGMEAFRSSPRQADLLIVSGRVAHKMAAPLRQIYDQMLEPKWVIAMGACASSGGMFNNYAILQGVDKIVAVDIHVPGCPPRPEALMEGIIRLHEKVQAGVPPAYEIRGVAVVTLRGRPGPRRDEGGARRDDARRRPGAAGRGLPHLRDEHGLQLPLRHHGGRLPRLGRAGGVAGYIGTASGRDLNAPGSQGSQRAARAEAEALRDELPPARAAATAPRARARPGLARRRRAGRRA